MKLWGSIVQVRLRRIGGDSSGEICLKQEQEQDTHLHVGRTKDWQYLVLNANSKSTSEVRRWRPITRHAAIVGHAFVLAGVADVLICLSG